MLMCIYAYKKEKERKFVDRTQPGPRGLASSLTLKVGDHRLRSTKVMVMWHPPPQYDRATPGGHTAVMQHLANIRDEQAEFGMQQREVPLNSMTRSLQVRHPEGWIPMSSPTTSGDYPPAKRRRMSSQGYDQNGMPNSNYPASHQGMPPPANTTHLNGQPVILQQSSIPKRGARACTACRKGKNRCEGDVSDLSLQAPAAAVVVVAAAKGMLDIGERGPLDPLDDLCASNAPRVGEGGTFFFGYTAI